MATCKDCLHYEVCSTFESLVLRILLCGEKAEKRCGLFRSTAVCDKTCNTCRCNKVCDHNKYGFENCDNYIPNVERKTDNE